MRQVPVAAVGEYSAEDADVTWQLYEALRPELAKVEMTALLRILRCLWCGCWPRWRLPVSI